MTTTLRDRLARGEVIRLDGGLATTLEAAGHELVTALWSARLLTDAPVAVVAAHAAFLRAGADVVLTASYQLAAESLRRADRDPNDEAALLARSVELAHAAVAGQDRPALVAGSLGPWGALIGGGREYVGRYEVGVDRLVEVHATRVAALVAAGVDAIAFETVPAADELAAIATVVTGCDVPVWVSATTDATGTATPEGTPLAEAFAPLLERPEVVAIGVNCVPPGRVLPALRTLVATRLPLVAKPNVGARYVAGTGWVDRPPEATADPLPWIRAGARLVGGCCGTDPTALSAMFDARPA